MLKRLAYRVSNAIQVRANQDTPLGLWLADRAYDLYKWSKR
jgi:hypothetical protein